MGGGSLRERALLGPGSGAATAEREMDADRATALEERQGDDKEEAVAMEKHNESTSSSLSSPSSSSSSSPSSSPSSSAAAAAGDSKADSTNRGALDAEGGHVRWNPLGPPAASVVPPGAPLWVS